MLCIVRLIVLTCLALYQVERNNSVFSFVISSFYKADISWLQQDRSPHERKNICIGLCVWKGDSGRKEPLGRGKQELVSGNYKCPLPYTGKKCEVVKERRCHLEMIQVVFDFPKVVVCTID